VVQIRDGRVSGESRGSGALEAVVNRGGWIRLPEELVGDAARAQLERAPGGILVRVAERSAQPGPGESPRSVAGGPVVAETVELTKVHGSGAHAIEVFRDLSLGFESGRLSAVTGPSGSGKSTLLNLLAGLDLPTAGDVVIAGTALSQLDATGRAELRRDRIGLVTQGTELVPFLTAQESVELGLALRGVDRREATERARESLAAVGLAELAQRTGTAIVCATHDPVLIEHAATEVRLGGAIDTVAA
jgi:ABC-type lipoprotein export system ATPase subunit